MASLFNFPRSRLLAAPAEQPAVPRCHCLTRLIVCCSSIRRHDLTAAVRVHDELSGWQLGLDSAVAPAADERRWLQPPGPSRLAQSADGMDGLRTMLDEQPGEEEEEMVSADRNAVTAAADRIQSTTDGRPRLRSDRQR